eukprot:3518345-Prymnesium_polylepis.1
MQRYVLDGGDTRRCEIQAVRRKKYFFSRTRYSVRTDRQAGKKESGDESLSVTIDRLCDGSHSHTLVRIQGVGE